VRLVVKCRFRRGLLPVNETSLPHDKNHICSLHNTTQLYIFPGRMHTQISDIKTSEKLIFRFMIEVLHITAEFQ
jgi:hypothetical protein